MSGNPILQEMVEKMDFKKQALKKWLESKTTTCLVAQMPGKMSVSRR